MDVIKKEIKLDNFPDSVSMKGTEMILKQMKECICKIYLKNGNKGTGFFCNVKDNNKNILVMITNNHIINEEYVKNNNEIEITLNNDKEKRSIILNKNRKIYTSKEYDTTIIEIDSEKDRINNYMEIDEKYIKNSNVIYDKSIYVIQYPLGKEVEVSYGIINNIDNYNIEHFCCTKDGSSGSPILNISNNKIIGIHKECLNTNIRIINRGTLLIYPIRDFINQKYIKNEIEIKLKIKKEEINKEIYYLDNTDYIEHNTNIKHYHDNLKELNASNTILYINNKQYKFKKSFIPKKEGEYKIKLIFKNNIKDCSFMFAGCKNIININFSNFNSKNIINMRYMFSGCINLNNLDLSSFNTKNVINMEGMFGKYSNLSNLDLSFLALINDINVYDNFWKNTFKQYFEGCINLQSLKLSSTFITKNVTNMMGMFCDCQNLENIDLPSSFDTKNVTNMMGMFSGCENIEQLTLPSSFDTKNVTNMMNMFCKCKKLEKINLPNSFNTENVTNMICMFGDCRKLENLYLPSSFNTKNVTNMMLMFIHCKKLENLNLSSSFNTEKVVNMMYMFADCKNLENLNLPSTFNTINVKNMMYMFIDCKHLVNLNLSSSFNNKNASNIEGMFFNCRNLKNLNRPSCFDIKKSINNIFIGCDYLEKSLQK